MHADTAALRRHVLARAPLCAPGDGPVLGLVFVTLFGALALDAAFGMTGQALGSLAVWALLLVLLARMTPAWRRTLVIATAFALAAELFFSLVLGWYDYQFLNVPAFVPPGHVLLFLLGPALACRLPQWLVIAVPLAVVAMNFLFMPPHFSLGIQDPHTLATECIMLGAGLAIGSGVLKKLPWIHDLPDGLDARTLHLGARVVKGVLLAAAVVALASGLWHAGEVAASFARLDVGFAEGALVVVLMVMLLPNAILWSLSALLGPGFSVGTGTYVSVSAVKLGPLPAFPLLAALPNEGGFAASGTCLTVYGNKHAWLSTGGAAKARVFRSTDQGQTWQVAETPVLAGVASAGIFSAVFRDGKRGVISGGDYRKEKEAVDNVALTEDGGQSWQLVKGVTGYRSGLAFVSVKLPAKGGTAVLLAVGPAGSDYSLDGGKSWRSFDEKGYDSVSAARNGNAAWASGAGGRIAKFSAAALAR